MKITAVESGINLSVFREGCLGRAVISFLFRRYGVIGIKLLIDIL
jgi:hypothetical protein